MAAVWVLESRASQFFVRKTNMNLNELAEQAHKQASDTHPGSFAKYDPDWFKAYNEKLAELILTSTFTVLKESMIDVERPTTIDEIIEDRLDDAAGDVCDHFELMGPIYEG